MIVRVDDVRSLRKSKARHGLLRPAQELINLATEIMGVMTYSPGFF